MEDKRQGSRYPGSDCGSSGYQADVEPVAGRQNKKKKPQCVFPNSPVYPPYCRSDLVLSPPVAP